MQPQCQMLQLHCIFFWKPNTVTGRALSNIAQQCKHSFVNCYHLSMNHVQTALWHEWTSIPLGEGNFVWLFHSTPWFSVWWTILPTVEGGSRLVRGITGQDGIFRWGRAVEAARDQSLWVTVSSQVTPGGMWWWRSAVITEHLSPITANKASVRDMVVTISRHQWILRQTGDVVWSCPCLENRRG